MRSLEKVWNLMTPTRVSKPKLQEDPLHQLSDLLLDVPPLASPPQAVTGAPPPWAASPVRGLATFCGKPRGGRTTWPRHPDHPCLFRFPRTIIDSISFHPQERIPA